MISTTSAAKKIDSVGQTVFRRGRDRMGTRLGLGRGWHIRLVHVNKQIMWAGFFTSNFLSFITPEVYNTEDSNLLYWKEELLGKPVISKSCFVRCGKTIRRVFAVHTQLAAMQSKRFFHIVLVDLW